MSRDGRMGGLGFRIYFYFIFSFGLKKGLSGLGRVNLAQFFISGIFSIFLTFFHNYSHFVQNLQNKIKSNKKPKITIMTSINRV